MICENDVADAFLTYGRGGLSTCKLDDGRENCEANVWYRRQSSARTSTARSGEIIEFLANRECGAPSR